MEFTKEQLEELKKNPLMNFFAGLLGADMKEIIEDIEKEQSHANKVEENKNGSPVVPESDVEEDERVAKQIEEFFNKMVKDGKATRTVENGHPHYSINMTDDWTSDTTAPDALVEGSGDEDPCECEGGKLYDEDDFSFSMSKEELADFIKKYTKLENTFRKLEHTFGVDLNANADSIYTQYNAIVWDLIEKIFGEDNRDDIADYIFGDSNFDSVEDLYEELV